MSVVALACTGDPLLDLMLTRCTSFRLRQGACETVEEAMREAEEHRPALLFTSPALGDLRRLAGLKQVRVCCLLEGDGQTAPDGIETLAAGEITPDLVDQWVRRPARYSPPAPAQSPPPLPSSLIPPPPPTPRGEIPAGGSPAPPVTAPPQPLPQGQAWTTPPPPQPQTWPPPRANQTHPGPHSQASRRFPGRHQAEAPRPALSVLRQQVITFWGGKPGAGRSTLAVALSDLLSRAGAIRVCTVDLNPYNSSLAALVGKEQEVPSWFHLSEALQKGSPLPADALRWIRPNWAILTGPEGRPEWAGLLTREAIGWLVDGLRSQFDYIVLDPESRPGPVSEAAARLAQTVFVTVSADYPDVLDTTRAFEAALEQGWLDRSRCRLILSRWLDTPHLPASDVAACFSLPVSLAVPSSPEAAVHASSQGVPITQLDLPAARPLAQAVGRLVGLVAEPVAGAGAERIRFGAQLRGWFSR